MALGVASIALALVMGSSPQGSAPVSSQPQVGAARALVASANAQGFITSDSLTLGYRVSLPATYRRSASIVGGDGAFIGRDIYTTTSTADERADCQQDSGDAPAANSAPYLLIEAYRNPSNTSAAAWARSAPQRTPRQGIEALTIGSLDAARLVEDAKSAAYVIRAADRIFVITPTVLPSAHPLDDIAPTFVATAPQPVAAAPAVSPRDSAAAVARQLSQAFAARDADAVGQLIPNCKLAVSAMVDTTPTGGVFNRSASAFLDALRTRFAAGDLSVVVDGRLQVDTQRNGQVRFFVGSDWIETDRTTHIDLVIDAVNGDWRWIQATQHFQKTDLLKRGSCLPLRTPWVAAASSC